MNYTILTASTNSSTNWLERYMHIPLFSMSLLFGLPTHSYVIWLIFTGTASGFAAEFFNLSHSFCETGTCADYLFFILSTSIPSVFPVALFFQGLSITGRPLFQCLICVERYIAVVHPVTFMKYKSLRYRVICSVVAWIFTLSSCFCCLIISFLSDLVVHAWFFSMQFLLYLPIQLLCLVAVLRALKETGPGERKKAEENHMKRRAFNIILITTLSMAITYVPCIISGFSTFLRHEFLFIYWVPSMICYVFGGFVQPFLFLHRAGKLSCLCSS